MKNPLIQRLSIFIFFIPLLLNFSSCNCDPDDLLIRTWTLTSYGAITAPISILPSSDDIVLNFFKQGMTISGTDGCNNMQGTYTADSNCNIDFPSIGTTFMLCTPQGVMDQATEYRRILNEVTTYKIINNELTLSSPTGEVLVYQ